MDDETFSVWIMVEDGNGGQRSYWSVNSFGSKAEAFENAQDMAEAEWSRTGIKPELLED